MSNVHLIEFRSTQYPFSTSEMIHNCVVLHLILLVPGIVLHPKVFEAISPYMEKVKGMCPCCKPKQD